MPPQLIGYADRISVAPGETVAFKVSTDAPHYDAAIVRLICGGEGGPRFKEEVVRAEEKQSGRKQATADGSYARVESHPALSPAAFTIAMWAYPTVPQKGEVQGLLSKREGLDGYALVLGERGDLGLMLGKQTFTTGTPLAARRWTFVAATFDAAGGITLAQIPGYPWGPEAEPVFTSHRAEAAAVAGNDAPLLMAALRREPIAKGRETARGRYNGRIDGPAIFGRALTRDEIERLAQGSLAPVAIGDLAAAWDFSVGIPTAAIHDTSPHGLDGILVNMPMRAVTGHNWRGSDYDHKHAPAEYAAIHFHDDDLDDCAWETDFIWQVPEGLRSGFYAARLRADGGEDHVPFFVRPPRGGGVTKAKVAVLAPTFTYLAYAGERLKSLDLHAAAFPKRPMIKDPLDHVLAANPEWGMSLYDVHSDGSGWCYSTWLRPITNMRPKYRQWQVAATRHLGADLNLIDWLEAKGIAHDVITDHDLHADGAELLEGYRVLITGTHPEYWSLQMLDAVEAYLTGGGHHMYLGGNGYYWVTAVDPVRPYVVEVRRGIAGSRAWTSAPGELYLSTTGEMGGLWRYRGRPPNRIAGIGFCGMGYDAPTPGYRRLPASFDPRVAFVFDGVGADEIIGDFGTVLGGAAGDEIDRLDVSLGSPPHALVLASAKWDDVTHVMPVVEDFPELSAVTFAQMKETVRADIVYFETANGGAVFSAGAISWCGSLSHNNYENNVSRITENVVRQFTS